MILSLWIYGNLIWKKPMDHTENDYPKYISIKNFDEPWHANLLALTVSLSERGVFSWSEWVDVFSSNLTKKEMKSNYNRDYFSVWFFSLEEVLLKKDYISKESLREVFDALVLAQKQSAH